MVSAVLSGTEERTGHEEEGVAHGEGIGVELRMSQKSTQCASRRREICLFAPSLLHLDPSDHIWIHLTNSHPSFKRVWSVPTKERTAMKRTLVSVKEVTQGLSRIVRPRGARAPALAGDAHSRNAPVR